MGGLEMITMLKRHVCLFNIFSSFQPMNGLAFNACAGGFTRGYQSRIIGSLLQVVL